MTPVELCLVDSVEEEGGGVSVIVWVSGVSLSDKGLSDVAPLVTTSLWLLELNKYDDDGVSGQTFFRVAIHLSPDFSVFSFDIVG